MLSGVRADRVGSVLILDDPGQVKLLTFSAQVTLPVSFYEFPGLDYYFPASPAGW
jgi:hypothetical protein